MRIKEGIQIMESIQIIKKHNKTIIINIIKFKNKRHITPIKKKLSCDYIYAGSNRLQLY